MEKVIYYGRERQRNENYKARIQRLLSEYSTGNEGWSA